MILYNGKIYDDSQQRRLISALKNDLYTPFLNSRTLPTDTVINACDILAKKLLNGEFDSIVMPYLKSLNISENEFTSMVSLFLRKKLEYKCQIELNTDELIIDGKLKRKRFPLGILLHIAAGNVDALPAYSVVEGLLSGNVNILKLPTGDSGISVKLLSELINIEPMLAEYIYVFDVPSTELETLKTLSDYSDAVVVWGTDIAVSAIRKMVSVNTKIISWGHKLSFAYATLDATDEQLRGLAKNICSTNQLLCSSCQGIYVDTNSQKEQIEFGKRFFEIFKSVNKDFPKVDMGMRGKNAINIYNEKLEQHTTNNFILSDNGISVICTNDSKLTLSYLYRNIWVKKLPHKDIINIIKPYKGYLQTVGVLCPCAEKHSMLCNIFANAGLVRITNGVNMSQNVCGEAHDGTYPLREYSRIVETELF